jgi:hypothetical protein
MYPTSRPFNENHGGSLGMKEKTKELIKDAVGRPKWWLINGTLIALFLALVIWVGNKSDAVEPTNSSGSVSSGQQTKGPVCGPTNELECKRTWANKKTRQFKNAKLGNAKGFRLPKNIRTRLDNKQGQASGYSTKVLADDDWWDFPGNVMKCLAYGGRTPACEEASKSQEVIAKNTVRVSIVCSGAGVIGMLHGGGWWGFGRGSGVCLWMKFAGLW